MDLVKKMGNIDDDCSHNKIIVKNLSISYRTKSGNLKAVDDISFEFQKGESIAVVGESGSGKSTLGLAIMRSLPHNGVVDSGSFFIDGEDVLNINERDFNKSFRWKKIAMIFQGSMNSLDPVFSIKKQMKEVLKVHQYHNIKDGYDVLIDNILSSVGLDPTIVTNKYPHELSGGMKQRVVIAMSLLCDPQILIADEPTTALDVIIQSQILHLLKNLTKLKKMSILLITHDLSLISKFADKVIIMYAGKSVEISDVKTIFDKPLHPYTQALIQSIPILGSTNKTMSFISGDPPNLLDLKEGCRYFGKCPKAFDLCKKDPPEVKMGSNMVNCWLYVNKDQTIN